MTIFNLYISLSTDTVLCYRRRIPLGAPIITQKSPKANTYTFQLLLRLRNALIQHLPFHDRLGIALDLLHRVDRRHIYIRTAREELAGNGRLPRRQLCLGAAHALERRLQVLLPAAQLVQRLRTHGEQRHRIPVGVLAARRRRLVVVVVGILTAVRRRGLLDENLRRGTFLFSLRLAQLVGVDVGDRELATAERG